FLESVTMLTITKALVAGLATFGAVQALPQQPRAAPPATTPIPPAPPATEDKVKLFGDLFTAPTAVKRFQRLLTDAGSLISGDALKQRVVFDFNGAQPAKGALGGATKAANIETFPILTGLGLSTTVGFLDACGMNTPHVHPRATEFLTLTSGTLDFGYVLENGLVDAGNNAEVANRLQQFQGTVFPMGSIHYQVNPNCEPATFVASLNSEDPGTSQVAQGFFGLNAGVVDATLGFPGQINGKNFEEFRGVIPANIARGIDECLVKCGLKGEKGY
ncbi:RmlC-like cupin, partial [Corynespora cassiicola Philippines]